MKSVIYINTSFYSAKKAEIEARKRFDSAFYGCKVAEIQFYPPESDRPEYIRLIPETEQGTRRGDFEG